MLMVEFFEKRFNGLFLFRVELMRFALQNLEEFHARFDEFSSLFFSLFCVLLVFRLFVHTFGRNLFFRIIERVYLVAKFVGGSFHAFFGDEPVNLFGKLERRVMYGVYKSEESRVNARNRRKGYGVVGDDFVAFSAYKNVNFVYAGVLDFFGFFL